MNFKTQLTKISTIVLFSVLVLSVSAQDRLFTYTYQSGVLNKGQREIEVWNTLRTGKDEYFSRHDIRTEYELGLGNNLQTSFYLNMTSITNGERATKTLTTEHELSFSNEWKYKVSDAVADPVGMALYGEVGISSFEYELETKLILDKKIGNFTLAANGTYELEYENKALEWEKAHIADFNFAVAYPLSQRVHITMENAYRNLIEGGSWAHSALYSGLGLSYVQENFWVNFTAMPQIKSFKGTSPGTSLNLEEYEKAQYRLLFSLAF